MKPPPFESPEQMAAATADKLAEACAHCAFKLFSDPAFRSLARFDQISQTEHDRIFNELLVSALLLVMFTFEAPDLDAPDDVRAYLARIATCMPGAHIKSLRALGIEQQHLDIWDKLITLRRDEYTSDRHHVRAAAMQVEEQALRKELDCHDYDKITLTLPVQVIAIGCHRHVCRGETDGRDELFKLQLRAFFAFYVHIRLLTQGRRLTWWMRLQVALKRLWRRLFRRR